MQGARFSLFYLTGFEKACRLRSLESQSFDNGSGDGHRASLSGELRRGDACRKAFADIADAGACQLYGRFSDQTGFTSALVLDGIGGAVSFGCGVFRLPSGDAAMQTGGKKAKALALGGACGFVCVVISARKPYGGTASAACRFALAESGVSGGAAGFIALAWQEGREKGCIKNLFCWRWQSPFF